MSAIDTSTSPTSPQENQKSQLSQILQDLTANVQQKKELTAKIYPLVKAELTLDNQTLDDLQNHALQVGWKNVTQLIYKTRAVILPQEVKERAGILSTILPNLLKLGHLTIVGPLTNYEMMNILCGMTHTMALKLVNCNQENIHYALEMIRSHNSGQSQIEQSNICITDLDLSDCILTAETLKLLYSGYYRILNSLNLSNNQIDLAALVNWIVNRPKTQPAAQPFDFLKVLILNNMSDLSGQPIQDWSTLIDISHLYLDSLMIEHGLYFKMH